uniref:Protein kinase atmrk1 n=1 Tax=Rhizophora mucronata TaxID=61149 RepID=A0A2P2KMJ2_RHIMU
MKNQGPRAGTKQKHPAAWSSGIIPPPLLVSIACNILTTSAISGRFSALASQHFRMIFAKELGQHLGISGRKFCQKIRCYITPNMIDLQRYDNIYK